MIFLFLVFLAVMICIALGKRQAAIILTLINFVLMLAMFYHHITSAINIQL